jgi:hypothetical protein
MKVQGSAPFHQLATLLAGDRRVPLGPADTTAPTPRDRLNDNWRIGVAGRPARRRIPPGRVRDGRVHRGILLFSWQPLSGG